MDITGYQLKISMKIEVITKLNSFANSMDYISKKKKMFSDLEMD
jgi:hypothetical protein